MVETFVPTRFYSLSYTDDGSLVLHNSRTGAIGAVPKQQAEFVRNALKRPARHAGPLDGILEDLRFGGFLVPEGTDENDLVHRSYLEKYNEEHLGLIILPTEECNFRCVYCYESFLRGEMAEDIREGIRRFVAKQSRLKSLEIHWFGGEPLLAPNVVIKLSEWFDHYAAEHGINYHGSITTNGSLLTPTVADAILQYGVRRFQITLDGERDEHNKRRILNGGGDTFDQIIENLRYLKNTNEPFLVSLRHNFDPESVERAESFVDMLKTEFGGDPRFALDFHPIARLGGANDTDATLCEGSTVMQQFIRTKSLAIEAGFRGTFQLEQMQPNGYTCYASDPRNFIIGSDGRLYKCTVELDYHDRNVVGQLHPDGTMTLDWRKMALWVETNGRHEGMKCNSCFFSPTCHGAVCPKDWLDHGDCECPPHKVTIRQVLPLMVKEARLPTPPDLSPGVQCARGY